MKKKVIIYRDDLLPYSETFIPDQVKELSSYTGFYVGTSRCRGKRYPLPADKTIVLSDMSKLTPRRKKLFLLTGLGYREWFNRVKAISADLIHAHFCPDGVWALPLQRHLKIPLIVTAYGYDITVSHDSKGFLRELYGPLYGFYLWQRQQLFKQAVGFVAISDFIRSKLVENGCPPDKIIINYLGVDIDKFKPDPNVFREPVVLFVGRLVSKKGCGYLIRAMSEVQIANPELELVVIGDGELRSQLEEQAKTSLKRYRFLGAQSPDIIKAWMNRSLLLVAPSITAPTGDSEGLCVVLLEAQAMELPVIGSFHGGMVDAVSHEETGFLAPEKDWKVLAEYILNLAQDTQLRERFAIAGRKRVEDLFNLKRNTANLEAIYDNILNSHISI